MKNGTFGGKILSSIVRTTKCHYIKQHNVHLEVYTRICFIPYNISSSSSSSSSSSYAIYRFDYSATYSLYQKVHNVIIIVPQLGQQKTFSARTLWQIKVLQWVANSHSLCHIQHLWCTFLQLSHHYSISPTHYVLTLASENTPTAKKERMSTNSLKTLTCNCRIADNSNYNGSMWVWTGRSISSYWWV